MARRWDFGFSCAIPLAALDVVHDACAGGRGSSALVLCLDRMQCLRNNARWCHLRQAGYFQHVADKACLSCHDAPVPPSESEFHSDCISCISSTRLSTAHCHGRFGCTAVPCGPAFPRGQSACRLTRLVVSARIIRSLRDCAKDRETRAASSSTTTCICSRC